MASSSTVHQEVEKLTKFWQIFFQSFICPQIIATAPIGFLFLKALYLSFQMHTSQVASWRHLLGWERHPGGAGPATPPVSNDTRTFRWSFIKNFYMRFQWWQTVLLEWDSNLANSCSVIEKKRIFWNVRFENFSLCFSYFFASRSKKIYIDTNNNSHQIVQ